MRRPVSALGLVILVIGFCPIGRGTSAAGNRGQRPAETPAATPSVAELQVAFEGGRYQDVAQLGPDVLARVERDQARGITRMRKGPGGMRWGWLRNN